jgi:hypothetical protein
MQRCKSEQIAQGNNPRRRIGGWAESFEKVRVDIAVSNLRMGMRHRTSQELSIIVNERASMLDSVIFKFSSKALILHWSLQNAGILAQCFEVFTICLIVIFLSNQRAYVVPFAIEENL